MAIIGLAKGDLKAISGYLKILKGAGNFFSVGSEVVSGYNYLNEPTTSNLINFTVSTGAIFLSPAASAALGVLDIMGITTKFYNTIGNMIDKHLGYSVGKEVFNKTKTFFDQFQTINP